MANDADRNRRSDDIPGGTNPPSADSGRSGRPRRRRRRWPYVIGFVVLCILIGLVILALVLPAVISSERGTRYAVAALNNRLRGTVKVQDVNLSWRGPSTLDGVTLLDPQQRRVLDVSQVTVREGLWRIVRSPMRFGQIDLDRPQTVLYLQQDQPPSLVQAVEPRQPAATRPAREEEAGPAPEPKGQLVIHSGTLRVVKPDGQELGVTDLNGQVTLDTLDNVRGQIAAQLASGGQVHAEANLKNLVTNGQVNANQATGQFAVRTDEPVKIAPLAAFADRPGVTGLVDLDLHGQLDRGALMANMKTQVNDFSTRAAGSQARPEPVDLILTGQVQRNPREQVNGHFDLAGGAGTANAKFAYAPTSQPSPRNAAEAPASQSAEMNGQNLLAMLLTGKPVDLPNVQASVQSNLDLRAMAAAMPDLLQIQEGVQITRGQLRIPDLQVRTQPALAAVGAVEVTDLAATRNGQPVDVQPVALNINAHVVPDQGLQVEQGQLRSGFANASVQGNPLNLEGRFDADLARLDRQMRQLVKVGDFELGGTIDGRFIAGRVGSDEVKLTSDIRAADVHYASGQQKLDVRQATLKPSASLLMQDQNLQRVVLHGLDADVDRQVVLTADGWYDFGSQAWKTDVNIAKAQLPYLVSLGRQMGVQAFEQYAGYTGSVSDLKMTAGWNPQAGAITSNGGGALAGLGRDGRTVADTIGLQWQDASYIPRTQEASLGTATVKADFANLAAENVKFQSGRNMTLDGRVRAGADVARTLAAVYTLTGRQQPPAIGGHLNLASNMNTTGDVVAMAGEATVDNFSAGSGNDAFRQERLQLVYDTQMDNGNETINLRQARLVSAPLTASLVGTIQQFRTRQQLDLRGDYRAKWDQVMPIMHQFAPATKETVNLKGDSSSQFTVAGPAWQEGVQPPYRDVRAEGLDVGWQSGDLYGLQLGQATLSPRLRNGRLELPVARIPASGGTISIGGTVDMTGKEPQLRMPGQLQLLQDIDLNDKIGKQLLSYVNPLFSQSAALSGKVSMTLQDIDLPLGESIKHTGSGRGQLMMQNVRVAPSGLFGVLIRIAGATQAGRGQQGQQGGLLGTALGEAGQLGQVGGLGQIGSLGQAAQGQAEPQGTVDIRVGSPTFVISNGRINYDNFALTFPSGVEMVFSGWVGFDDTVQMYVGMPVTAGLLSLAGVKGPVAQYAGVLQGTRIDVPLVGSRTEPRLDFTKIKFNDLVQQAIRNLASQGIQQGIRTAVPGGQLLPLPGQQGGQGQGGTGGLLPKLPIPGLPGQQQEPPPQNQQEQGQQQQQQQQQPATPGQQIEKGLQGIFGR